MIKDKNLNIESTAELIEIPRSYYEKAVERYTSIGEWLHRPESRLARFEPTVYVQGSFQFGTVTRPVIATEEYDLDLVCEARLLSKKDVTQSQLKQMLGDELSLYAQAHGIKEPLIERKRCWRLEYADHVNFHIDNLVCIPETEELILQLVQMGVPPVFAKHAIALTCKSHPAYKLLSMDWPTSNPAGYAIWFEQQCSMPAQKRRRRLLAEGLYGSIEQIPFYALKTPLQRSIQILKRHRDFMFRDTPDLKPISMIITTLAALAYEGEEELEDALRGILQRMPLHVSRTRPRNPNPVNPGEDFADKWTSNPILERNFWLWYQQALLDVEALITVSDPAGLRKLSERRLGLTTSTRDEPGSARRYGPLIVTTPAITVSHPPRPWSA